MLSVNGFIESARSGDFGKGFEVVSSDIKNLATEGSENIDVLQSNLTGIEDQFDVFSQLLTVASAEVLTDMENVSKTGGMVEECVEMTEDSYRNMETIERGSQEALERIDSVVSASEQIASAAEETARTTEELAQAISQIEQAVRQIAQAIEADIPGSQGSPPHKGGYKPAQQDCACC